VYRSGVIIGAIVIAILSIAIVVVIPLCASGRIPRNPFVGLRLPAFFATDDAWEVGHRAAVPSSVCGAIIGFLACVLVVTVPSLAPVWFAVAVAAILVGLIIGAVVGTRAANRVAR
jgi:hypothetical protein